MRLRADTRSQPGQIRGRPQPSRVPTAQLGDSALLTDKIGSPRKHTALTMARTSTAVIIQEQANMDRLFPGTDQLLARE